MWIQITFAHFVLHFDELGAHPIYAHGFSSDYGIVYPHTNTHTSLPPSISLSLPVLAYFKLGQAEFHSKSILRFDELRLLDLLLLLAASLREQSSTRTHMCVQVRVDFNKRIRSAHQSILRPADKLRVLQVESVCCRHYTRIQWQPLHVARLKYFINAQCNAQTDEEFVCVPNWGVTI